MTGVPLVAMYGGVALYLLGHVAFRLRNVHSVNRQRVVTVAVLVALIGYESTVHAEARHAVRHVVPH